jgi:hypothetical protein
MTDWSTIASPSTAGGTFVLAAATFTSVRASQRSARIAEQALLIGPRPVLGPGREDDHEGGQRAVSRFSIWPTGEGRWLPGISRHFRLDGVNPRD